MVECYFEIPQINAENVLILDTKTVCKVGDGKGGNETQLSGNYTIKECIAVVQEKHPTANGATMDANCPNKCKCWAEFGMKTWTGIIYQSCKFIKEGELPRKIVLLFSPYFSKMTKINSTVLFTFKF